MNRLPRSIYVSNSRPGVERSWRLRGGLDYTSPRNMVYRKPGILIDCANYEALAEGYRRIDGYERYDGRPAPSTTDDKTTAATLRSAIGRVPGNGEILGVCRYKDATYAFRRGSNRHCCAAWKSSPRGWTDAGAGDLLSTSRSLEDGETAGSGWRFEIHNFMGQAAQERLFGVNPAGQIFTYDGSVWSLINILGLGHEHVPIGICSHQNHLFVAFRDGSILHSALGDPTSFEAAGGAAELTIGDTVTNMLPGYRGGLFIYGRNSTWVLRGSSAANWTLERISNEGGAMRHTAAMMDEPVVYDDRGLRSTEATETFGDFSIATLSDPIRPLLDAKRRSKTKPTAAWRVRSKSQYRLAFDDGEIIVMTLVSGGRYTHPYYSLSRLDIYPWSAAYAQTRGIVTCVDSREDSDGRERIFFAMSGSAFIYEMDKGNSFDGERIPAFLRLPYNDLGHPVESKKYKSLLVDVGAGRVSKLNVRADFLDALRSGAPGEELRALSAGNILDEGLWSEIIFSGRPQQPPKTRLFGKGRNISIVVASGQNTVETPHVLTGMALQFNMLRAFTGRLTE